MGGGCSLWQHALACSYQFGSQIQQQQQQQQRRPSMGGGRDACFSHLPLLQRACTSA
jgi:hypothetical protein